MRTFSIQELHECADDLGKEAAEGRLSVVTRHGQTLFISVPFTEALLQMGVHAALAVNLFKSGDLTPNHAAKLARMSLPQFLEYVSAQDIAVVMHEAGELEQELAAFHTHGRA